MFHENVFIKLLNEFGQSLAKNTITFPGNWSDFSL